MEINKKKIVYGVSFCFAVILFFITFVFLSDKIDISEQKNKIPPENIKEKAESSISETGGQMDQLNKLDKECSIALMDQTEYLNKEKFFEEFTFDRYKTTEELKTTPADLDINSSKSARMFRTSIRQDLKDNGVNFSGHYTITNGAGLTGWQNSLWIVDRSNGKAHEFPYAPYALDFRNNSNLLIMDSRDIISKHLSSMKGAYNSPCVNIDRYDIDPSEITDLRPFYFLWQNNELILLAPKTINPPVTRFWSDYFD